MKLTGKVKWFNAAKGFGFVEPDKGGKDVFIHVSVVKAAGLEGLEENQSIEYEVVEDRGRESADNISLI
jgi:CspA family cold shock protein